MKNKNYRIVSDENGTFKIRKQQKMSRAPTKLARSNLEVHEDVLFFHVYREVTAVIESEENFRKLARSFKEISEKMYSPAKSTKILTTS